VGGGRRSHRRGHGHPGHGCGASGGSIHARVLDGRKAGWHHVGGHEELARFEIYALHSWHGRSPIKILRDSIGLRHPPCHNIAWFTRQRAAHDPSRNIGRVRKKHHVHPNPRRGGTPDNTILQSCESLSNSIVRTNGDGGLELSRSRECYCEPKRSPLHDYRAHFFQIEGTGRPEKSDQPDDATGHRQIRRCESQQRDTSNKLVREFSTQEGCFRPGCPSIPRVAYRVSTGTCCATTA